MNDRQLLHKIRKIASEYLHGYSKHPADATITRLIDNHFGYTQPRQSRPLPTLEKMED